MVVTLCLACSSSLPPKASASDTYYTACCRRPICPTCLSSNPRLARYNPCLACLGGVNAASASTSGLRLATADQSRAVNIDAAFRDEDIFVLGDDDDDDGGEDEDREVLGKVDTDVSSQSCRKLDSESQSTTSLSSTSAQSSTNEDQYTADALPSSSLPNIYYIRRGDSLLGISLKLGVDGRTLCRLNNLPTSTLSTTPHLLHTRTTLLLPSSVNKVLQSVPTPQDREEEERRKQKRDRERAEKRLQTLTKEVDWRVAKAYVALADLDPDAQIEYSAKRKEAGASVGKGMLEERAVDLYLDDNDWEGSEIRAGRKIGIQDTRPSNTSRWWQWKQ